MSKEELEKYIKMRCAMILSGDYTAADERLEDVVEDMYMTLVEHVYEDPEEF